MSTAERHDRYSVFIENSTSQKGRSLLALLSYDPEQLFNTMYLQADAAGPEWNRYLGQIHFFDVTLEPGEVVEIRPLSAIGPPSLETPYFLLRFDSAAEMDTFEGNLDFANYFIDVIEGFSVEVESALGLTKKNAQLIYDLERKTGSLTSVTAVGTFHHGLAEVVYRDGTEGFIDAQGNILVPPDLYAGVEPFSEDKAVVCRYVAAPESEYGPHPEDYYGELGFIDTKGNYTAFQNQERADSSLAMSNAPLFHDGYVHIQWAGDGSGVIYDSQGEIVHHTADGPVKEGTLLTSSDPNVWASGPLTYGAMKDVTISFPDGTPLLSASEDKPLKSGQWNVYQICPFDDGLAFAWVLDNLPGMTDEDPRVGGFISKSGEMVIEPQYTDFWSVGRQSVCNVFINGIACVRNRNGLYGGIDTKGNTVTLFQYKNAFLFNGDGILAAVTVNGKVGYIDKNNRMVIPAIYETVGSAAFSFNGLVRVCKNGMVSYLDTTGKEILPFQYDIGSGNFSEGFALVRHHQTFNIIANPLN